MSVGMYRLLSLEDVLDVQLLESLVCVVDEELLEPVLREYLESVDVE